MDLHPDFPVVDGHYQMTNEWSVVLPGKFNRRIEESDLVLWRPGTTIWVSIWGNDNNESQQERLAWNKDSSSPDAEDIVVEQKDGLTRYSYSLIEESDDNRQPAFYCFVFSDAGHVQMAIYYDSATDLATAKTILNNVQFTK